MLTQMSSIPAQTHATVIDGDVIGSRNIADSTIRLDSLCRELNRRLAAQIEAEFKRTKGDEIQGLLQLTADPLKAYLAYALRANRLPMRWVLVSGLVNKPSGPATDGDGDAYIRASSLLERMRSSGELLRFETGQTALDRRLAVFAPWIGAWIANLTNQQRAVLEVHLLSAPEVTQGKLIARQAGVTPSVVSKVLNDPTNQRMLALLNFIGEDLASAQEGLR